MTDPKKKISLKQIAGKIESKEEAVKVIKDCSNAFLLLAAIEVIAGFALLGMATVIDGIIFAILAIILRKFHSRIAAIILLVLSLASVVVTITNNISGSGGSNIILAIVIVYASARGIQATFKYNEKTDTKIKI